MTTRSCIDQMGNHLELTTSPQRIVSLVPSQTELLFDLGLEKEVAGVTKFCVHPEHWRKTKTIVGGTKNFDLKAIQDIQPDLIIGNKEENYVEGIDSLKQKFPVWMSDITTFQDALDMISSLSKITDRSAKGRELLERIDDAFKDLIPAKGIRALYLMWCKPWMGAAAGTFIHTMMLKAGFVNVLNEAERYPELTEETIIKLNPSLVFLSTEPFPFSDKHEKIIHDILPHADVKIVDGEMFSWYGSRLALAPAYFNSL